jgi:hypothetical protein
MAVDGATGQRIASRTVRLSSLLSLAALASLLLASACGGKPAPSTPSQDPSPATKPAASASASAASTAAPPGEPYDDPNESAQALTLEPLFKKGATPTFPKATVGDRECWEKINLTGDHQRDHATIAESCGAPTGLLAYTKPALGRLHHAHDTRDTYTIKLQGGLCYRFFAVADGTARNLDLLVTKVSGALVENDKTRSPVAIIHNNAPWCVAEDVEYQFHLEIESPNHGHYLFSTWARPKK